MTIETYLQFVLALVFVLALIGVIAWIARRYGIGLSAAVPRSGKRRLSVVETTALDTKRRLVLVRRDAVEHLLLIGPNADTVIESAIPAAGGEAPGAGSGAPPPAPDREAG